MGIIKRQGLKGAFVNYVGVAIGALSTLFIYPLDLEIYGLAQFLLSVSIFLSPFATLGVTNLIVRFFPEFRKNDNGHQGFLGFILLCSLICMFVFGLAAWLLNRDFLQLLDFLGFDAILFENNFLIIAGLLLLTALGQIFINHASNFQRVVVPAIFSNLFQKVGLPIIVLLSFYSLITEKEFTWLLVAIKAIILIALVLYILRLGQLKLNINWSFYKKSLLKKMAVFAFFGAMGSMGSVMAFSIDSIMVASLIDVKNNGIYNIAVFIATIILIPYRSISAIAAPLISSAWNQNDLNNIRTIYRKSALNLFIAGIFIFVGVWVSLDDLFRLTPRYDELITAKYVVFFIGIAKIIDMTTGISGHIIGLSRFFRFNLLAVVFLAVLNVITNYTLIPIYQIQGAAMATALSLILFNMLKFLFVLIKFRMQPFNFAFLKILLLATVVYLATRLLPVTSSPIVNILMRSVLVVVLFIPPVIYLNISPDISQLFWQVVSRIRKIVKR